MASAVTSLTPDSLRRMHRSALERPSDIRALLEHARRSRSVLSNGIDGRINRREARVVWVGRDRVGLAAAHIDPAKQPQIYFNFELNGSRYFFAAAPVAREPGERLEVWLPSVIYEAERRDLPRDRGGLASDSVRSVELRSPWGSKWLATVADWSYDGLAVLLPKKDAPELGAKLEVRFLDGERAGEHAYAVLRHRTDSEGHTDWIRLGLSVTRVPPTAPIPIERRDRILDGGARSRVWREFSIAGSVARAVPDRLARRLGVRRGPATKVEVVEYRNQRGEPIKAIVDRTGDVRGAPVVVISPAWGRTKETLLPLAATLVRTFERAGEPISVLRFDGTNRRGESYIAPDCRRAGEEYLRFTFSQAVRDIHATIDFLDRAPEFRPSHVILVTFSLASVEGRRAVATDPTGRLSGWVSVVGMVDLHSGLRSASGGVDYAYGLSRGVRFGRHEIAGVVADMDLTGNDVLQHRLSLFEDAKRDMAAIKIPVTWIHGRHDGWIDGNRVRELVSSGDTTRRRLLEVPTGHQLRTSRQALETFQLISQEVAEMCLGRPIEPVPPNVGALERRREAERRRRPPVVIDLRRFWRDYLMGRDGGLGIEILAATTAYQELMAKQIVALELRAGQRVLDLGAGTGEFAKAVAHRADRPKRLSITSVDYVGEGLARGRERFVTLPNTSGISTCHIVANLELGAVHHIPVARGEFHAVLASLLISYLRDPEQLLIQIRDLLRPGGRLVVSTPRRDADLSKIYVDGMAELQPDRVRELFGGAGELRFDVLQRQFLNSGERLLALEEAGRFRFWDAWELARLVRRAGFRSVRTQPAFGDPPQVIVLSARRP